MTLLNKPLSAIPASVGTTDVPSPRPFAVAPTYAIVNAPVTDRATILRAMEWAEHIVRGLNNKARVRWGVKGIGTDYSTGDADGRWTIHLNPERLVYDSQFDAERMQVASAITGGHIQSLLGAAGHELAHTLLTPARWKLDAYTTHTFRVYEDAYINTWLVNNRLPVMRDFIGCALDWSNPNEVWPKLESAYQSDPQKFVNVANIVTFADLFSRWYQSAPTLPDARTVDLLTQVQAVSDPLFTGDELVWRDRVAIFEEIAAILKDACNPEPTEPDKDKDEDGEPDKGEGEGEGKGSGGDPDADASPGADPDPDADASPGTESPQQDEDSSASGDENDSPKTVEEDQGDPDSIKRLRPLHCEDPREGKPNLPGYVEDAIKGANAAADAGEAEGQGIGALADAEFAYRLASQPYGGREDKARIGKLQRAFATRSQSRRQIIHGTDTGRVSRRRLYRAAGGSERVFKQRPVLRQKSGAILLLIDASGSMAGANWQAAEDCAYHLYKAIGASPDYSLHVWAYAHTHGELAIEAASFKGGKLLWPSMVMGGTPSFQAMAEAARWLKRRYPNPTRRVIVHFTDLGWAVTHQAEFTAHVVEDDYLTYSTVTVETGGINIPVYQAQFPEMHISGHSHHDLIKAVEEMVRTIP